MLIVDAVRTVADARVVAAVLGDPPPQPHSSGITHASDVAQTATRSLGSGVTVRNPPLRAC